MENVKSSFKFCSPVFVSVTAFPQNGKEFSNVHIDFSIICCLIFQIALTVLAVMRYRAGVSENLSSRLDFGYPSDQFADPHAGGQLP